MRRFPAWWGVLVMSALVGCDKSPVHRAITTPAQPTKPVAKAPAKPATPAPTPEQPKPPKPAADDGWADTLKVQAANQNGGGGTNNPPPSGGRKTTTPLAKATPMSRIAAEIGDAVRVRKTLVIWLIDQTTVTAMRNDYTTGLPILYGAIERGEKSNPLLTAVVGYGEKATFVTDAPVENSAQAQTAVQGVGQQAGKANTFAAVKETAEKYESFRRDGCHVVTVLVTGGVGEDTDKLNDAIAAMKKLGAKLFILGQSMPFSQAAAKDKKLCDSLMWERIDMDLLNGGSDADLADSGFGPFALGRLAKETDGLFLVTKPMSGGFSAGYDPMLLKKYSPDYVSPEQYEKLLSDNRAKKAVVEAAKLAHTPTFRGPGSRAFAKGNEVTFAKAVSEAQKLPATADEPIDRMFRAIVAGESDRGKITEPRWQANFDLAAGRIYAAKAKVEGYNQILAIMKTKPFSKEGNSTWHIEPAETTKEVSAVDNMVKKSRTYLERVVKDHPNTPWALLAERELQDKMLGWTLHE